MDIKTKYNIGDKVFYVDQNAIKRGVINGIVFILSAKNPQVFSLWDVRCYRQELSITRMERK